MSAGDRLDANENWVVHQNTCDPPVTLRAHTQNGYSNNSEVLFRN